MSEKNLLADLKEAAKDEKFMEGLFDSADYKEFAQKLSSKGIEVSDEEAKRLFEGMKTGNAELSEDALDDVAGGSVALAAWGVAGGVAFLYGCYKSYIKHCR